MTRSVAATIAAKDLRLEWRSKSSLGSVVPFAATVLLAFGFALGPNQQLLVQTAPGLMWLAALLAAVDLFHRSYLAETARGALEGLLLAPIDRGSIYLGKAGAVAVQLAVLFAVTGVLTIALFGLPLGPRPGVLLVVVGLGIVGLAAVGSLFGLLGVLGRARHAALPILVLPLVTPVVIAAIRATADLTAGSSDQVAGWIGLLAAFDAAFLATGYLVFGHLLED